MLRPTGPSSSPRRASPCQREIVEIDWDAETAEKQGYETFMLKEIHEQADAVAETIGERAARGWGIDLGRSRRDRRRAAASESGGSWSWPAEPRTTPA